MCGGSQLITVSMVTFAGSSDRDERSGGPGSCILWGLQEVLVWLFMDGWTCGMLTFCMHVKKDDYMPVWCRWQAALLCVSIGVCASVCFTVSLRSADILCGNYSLCVPVSAAGWLSCSTSAHPLLNTAPDCWWPQHGASAPALTNGLSEMESIEERKERREDKWIAQRKR